jgi:hypothetical protein
MLLQGYAELAVLPHSRLRAEVHVRRLQCVARQHNLQRGASTTHGGVDHRCR